MAAEGILASGSRAGMDWLLKSSDGDCLLRLAHKQMNFAICLYRHGTAWAIARMDSYLPQGAHPVFVEIVSGEEPEVIELVFDEWYKWSDCDDEGFEYAKDHYADGERDITPDDEIGIIIGANHRRLLGIARRQGETDITIGGTPVCAF